MLGGPIVDVAIGLIFFYILLSLVCSAVQELLAAVIGLRSSTMKTGVENLVGAYAEDMYKHPLIAGLSKAKGRPYDEKGESDSQTSPAEDSQAATTRTPDKHSPSYIRVETLAATLLEVIASKQTGGRESLSELGVDDLRAAVEKIEERHPVRGVLLSLIDQGESDMAKVKQRVADWFDEGMDRVSGWYKRRVQYCLFVIAALVTVAVNADTLRMAERLWTDEALRNNVVAHALDSFDAGKSEKNEEPGNSGDGSDGGLLGALGEAHSGLVTTFPLGYTDVKWVEHLKSKAGARAGQEQEDTQDEPGQSWLASLRRTLVGWTLTAAAISLGAPFWFDVLGRVAHLRGSGPRAVRSGKEAD